MVLSPKLLRGVVVVSHGNCQWTQPDDGIAADVAMSGWAYRSSPPHAFPPGPRAVILNGAEESRCVQTISRTEMRRQWGVSDTDVVVGYLGRLGVEKNPLAAAMAVSAPWGHRIGRFTSAMVWRWTRSDMPLPSSTRGRFLSVHDDVGNVLRAFDVFILG